MTITTTGGLTGVAEGAWRIDSGGDLAAGRDLDLDETHRVRRSVYRYTCKAKLSDEDLREVKRLVSSAKPSEWKERYVNPQYPHGYADGIGVSVELSGRAEGEAEKVYSSSWNEAAGQVPKDLSSVYQTTRLLKIKYCQR